MFKKVMAVLAIILAMGMSFFLGISYGSKTLGLMVERTSIYEAIGVIKMSLRALDAEDLVQSNQVLELQMVSALAKIGSYNREGWSWPCSQNDLDTLEAARAYSMANPNFSKGPLQKVVKRGIDLCLKSGTDA